MSLADEMILNLVNAGGLTGQAFAQGQQNYQNQQLGQQKLQVGQMQIAAAQQKQQQAQQYQTDLQAYGQNPTSQSLAMLMAKYPQQADELKSAYEVMDAPARQSRLSNLFSLYSLAEGGKADAAASRIDGLIAAEKGQGLDTSDAEEIRAGLQSTDPTERQSALTQLKAHTQAHLAIADSKFAKGLGIGDYENHFTPLGNGQVLDQRTGTVTGERVIKPEWQFDPTTGSWLQKPGTGGGDPNLGGTGASGSGAPGRTQFGWTPRASAGGDNTDAAVDGKLSGMAQFLGRDVDASIADLSPMQIAQALTLSEGGKGSLADRNNNPGNLTDGKGGYRKFPTKEAGLKAAAAQVARNLKRGQTSIRTMVEGLPVGGARPATSTPGVVNVRPPRIPTRMTADEVRAEGLDPNTVYYRSADGVPTPVGGQTRDTVQFKQVPPAVETKTKPLIDTRDSLRRLSSTFKSDFAGHTVTGGVMSTIQGLTGLGPEGMRDWWADFSAMDNQVHNSLFGSALTDNEKAAYEATTITPRMDPAQAQKNLKRRLNIIEQASTRQQSFLKKNRYDPDAVDALFAPLGGGNAAPAQAAPRGWGKAVKVK